MTVTTRVNGTPGMSERRRPASMAAPHLASRALVDPFGRRKELVGELPARESHETGRGGVHIGDSGYLADLRRIPVENPLGESF